MSAGRRSSAAAGSCEEPTGAEGCGGTTVNEWKNQHIVQDVGQRSVHHQLRNRRVAAVAVDGKCKNVAVVLQVKRRRKSNLRTIVDVFDFAAFDKDLHGLVASLTASDMECVPSRLHETSAQDTYLVFVVRICVILQEEQHDVTVILVRCMSKGISSLLQFKRLANH